MIIDYDTGLTASAAESRLFVISAALQNSKLKFKLDKVYKRGSFVITIETLFPMFDSWHDMQDYVRGLIVEYKKTLHAEDDYKRLAEIL